VNTLDAALRYIRAGLPVLPLRGKNPATEHGVKDASLDEYQVRAWFRNPAYNVGIAVPEGLVVLDVDPRNGGRETAAALTRDLGPLPETLRARTGGGGWHVWLATRALGRELVGKLGDGLDVKKSGGYVVAPPSVHPDTGRPYVWHTLVRPAPAPTVWAERLRRPVHNVTSRTAGGRNPSGGAISTEAEALEAIARLVGMPKGGRDNALFAVAAGLRDGIGLTAELEQKLVDAALASGLGASRVERTIKSALDGNGTR